MQSVVRQRVHILFRIRIGVDDVATLEGVGHRRRIAHQHPVDVVHGDAGGIIVVRPLRQRHRLLMRPVRQLVRAVVDRLVRIRRVGFAGLLHHILAYRIGGRERKDARQIRAWIGQRHDQRLVVLRRRGLHHIHQRAVVARLLLQVFPSVYEVFRRDRPAVRPGDVVAQRKRIRLAVVGNLLVLRLAEHQVALRIQLVEAFVKVTADGKSGQRRGLSRADVHRVLRAVRHADVDAAGGLFFHLLRRGSRRSRRDSLCRG